MSYGLFQFPAGYLADRLQSALAVRGALLVWSAAGFLTGMAHTRRRPDGLPGALGMGEAFNWPCRRHRPPSRSR